MDQPIANATRVPQEMLREFVFTVAQKAGIPEQQATLLSKLLIENDLRGVLNHGSRQMLRYTREIRKGGLNPTPRVTIVRETPTSLLLDGDFGLGYFPAYEGTLKTIEKAKQHGMAALVTRHHGHIGAAGIYARMTLEHDLCTFVTSGVQLNLRPGDPAINAAGASPMAFSAPTLNETPLVLDCGVTHDIQGAPPSLAELTRVAPGLVMRAVGFGTVCQAWGGLLAGLPIDAEHAQRAFRSANQGAMLFTFKISLFADVDSFKREMDEYVQRVKSLRPLVGDSAFLPGGIEARNEVAYRRDGIPLSEAHQRDLETVATEMELALPWA